MYTIEQLSCITGLTTRTLRNYLKSNILQGSKDSGMWHFTEEQVSDFIYHPAVYPSIQAKHHAIVYDFLAGQDNGENEICVLLTAPWRKTKQRRQPTSSAKQPAACRKFALHFLIMRVKRTLF